MNPFFKTIIVEDEALARNRLKKLLASHENRVEIIGEADNGEDGFRLIEKEKPDLIFLDVQMPVLNGFEMLGKLSYMPKIIFTTAYEEYAIKAFEENSIDYLLKPISAERLAVSIMKLERFSPGEKEMGSDNQMIETLIQKLKPQKELTTLSVKSGDRIFLVRLEEVVFFEAKDKYVFIHDQEGKEYLIDLTLTKLAEKLPSSFMRIHRAYIINKQFLGELRKGFTGRFKFVLTDKAQTKISSGSSYSKVIREEFEF